MGTTFVYVGDGILPNEGSQGSHPSFDKSNKEVTHIDETTFPQVSGSVNDGGSQVDLTSVSMDPASRRMVDDLVDSEMTDDGQEEPLKPRTELSSANEAGNETSYHLFGTSTASELEACAEQQNQPPIIPRPLLPSIYNSPFAPQPGEATPNSRPGTAKRTTPGHSRQNSHTTFPLQQPVRHNIESSQSSMPGPTNPNPPIDIGYRNQPYVNTTFPTRTNYTTGGKSAVAYENDNYSALDACHFISPTIDFGCSGSVKGVANVQTPPNGQGAG